MKIKIYVLEELYVEKKVSGNAIPNFSVGDKLELESCTLKIKEKTWVLRNEEPIELKLDCGH